jgi:hypothetical protein
VVFEKERSADRPVCGEAMFDRKLMVPIVRSLICGGAAKCSSLKSEEDLDDLISRKF